MIQSKGREGMPASDENLRASAGKEEAPEPGRKLFGTFGGVFTPTLLTILGVIMYLRQGWVVGNAGLLGAWLIILLSFGITGFTGLSLSSMATNIRIRAGGAFSVISQSLGLEVGGSIGVPLYVSQSLAVVMYIFGFRTGWLWIFPDHSAILVDLVVFAVLFGIAFMSTGLAFRIQYVILAIIIGSLISVLVSVFLSPAEGSITWWGSFPGSPESGFQGVGFWVVFAVFFPASTGIMAGANMSGDLANPRRSIPVGTLSAIAISLVIYMLLALWLATRAPTEELVENYTVMIDLAAWGPIVVAGLLGATFSSALSSLVGAPRILQALGEHRILPGSTFFAKRTKKGEPRNAMLLTGLIVIAALMLRDLNAIAPLITMFFLLTYAMINFVVLVEQSLGLVSFRPLLRVPRFVPLLGAAGCLFAMFIVNAVFSLVAVALVVVIHALLVRKHLRTPYSDVRSGLFVALAEWAAKKMTRLTAARERTWKANLLVPVQVSSQAVELYPLLRSIAAPKGFVRMVGLTGRRNHQELTDNLPELTERFRSDDVFSNWTVVDAGQFGENLSAGIEALGSAFFRSNVVFLRLPQTEPEGPRALAPRETESTEPEEDEPHPKASPVREDELRNVVRDAEQNGLGVLLYSGDSAAQPGSVTVYLPRPDDGWQVSLELGSADLALLTAVKIAGNTESQIRLAALVTEETESQEADEYLQAVKDAARIPGAQTTVVHHHEVKGEADRETPNRVDLSIYPVRAADAGFDRLREIRDQIGEPCLFSIDSGKESALA